MTTAPSPSSARSGRPAASHGIPVRVAGDDTPTDAAPYRVHGGGRWSAQATLNTIREECVHDRKVAAFADRPKTYDELVRLAVRRNHDGEAVVCGSRRVSYGALDRMIDGVARWFIARGLATGDRVAVMLDNRLEYVVAMLATIRAGGIAVPLGTRLGPDDVAHIVGDATPRLVVTADEWISRFPRDDPASLFTVDAAAGDPRAFSVELDAAGGSLPRLDPGATMMIVYTSGTTGKPKGARLSHVNFVHTCLHYLYALAIDRPLRSLLVVPATHIAGFGPVLSVTLASAGTIVLLRDFKADRVMETLARERVTFAVLVPAMYQLCLMDPSIERHDLSRWRYGVYGGAVMPPAVIERVSIQLPALRMINAYGATETCAVCTIMPPELTAAAPASVGLPLHCDEIRIVDREGVDVAAGETGELLIRGPNVSAGYWNDEAATSRAFVDGYWRSGDLASRDADGLIYIHDRIKDMINRGGFKVFSAEVENALMAHPDVDECAIVGVPDAVLGEKTFAFVTGRGGEIGGAALRAYLRERITDYKVPDFWHVTSEPVPRNQNGKLQKTEVRRLAAGLLEGATR